MRNVRVPLVLQRRIFTLCTKVHAYVSRKIPCPAGLKANVFPHENHVLTGHKWTLDDIEDRPHRSDTEEKNNNFWHQDAAQPRGNP